MSLYSARKAFALLIFRHFTSVTDLHSPHSLLQFIQLSITHQSLKLTQQSHARVLTFGLEQNAFLATKLISAYAACGGLKDCPFVFDSVLPHNVCLWNSLINGYVKNFEYVEAFSLFNEMQRSDILPDDYTLATMAKISSERDDMFNGKTIHGKSIRVGFFPDIVVGNSLMSMYCKCGEFREARKLFDEMPQRNSASWNVLLAGYTSFSDSHYDEGTWEVVKTMKTDGVKPDAFTVSSLLPLCSGDIQSYNYGRALHGYLLKNNLDLCFDSVVHLGCCLIDFYSRCKKVNIGRRVFDRMKGRNVYAWTAMIGGYMQNGDSDEAFILFRTMQVKDRIEPNRVSLVSVLPACSSHTRLTNGKEIHGFAIRKKLNSDVSLCNAIIDMYSKCGSLDYARKAFEDSSFRKDAISWTTIISAYGLHGQGNEAMFLYDKMIRQGIKSDRITMVGILSACGKSGLVNEGLNIYNTIIEPTVEICATVVDMLGRSGQLNRALDFIQTMPTEPGPSVWGALVSASVIHGNSEMQELAYKFLIQLEPKNPSNFISLSNLYASTSKWDGVAEVRKMMKERGLSKVPGCSWISINSKTHCFRVSDKAHSCSTLIYEVLDQLVLVMKAASSHRTEALDV